MTRDSYRINSPNVVLEVFEDEVVLVNLDIGAYYSAEGAGGRIVSLLHEGTSGDDLVRVVLAEFEGPPEAIEGSVVAFLGRLKDEGLIVEAPVESAAAPRAAQATMRPFQEPVLEKYTDLRDLLLLDPIHDVDQTGWPALKTPTRE
jgi:Coenzyme PQQ synthesis protein D (PqqD)